LQQRQSYEWARNRLLWASNNEDAPLVVLGVPLDETTSFRPGTRFGPQAIREGSQGLEEYSLRQRRTVDSSLCYDAGDLILPMGNVENALNVIGDAARDILAAGKKFIALGGEHLMSLPLVDAMLDVYPDLVVIQFDAHADLRSQFTGTKYSHATVMRRLVERLGSGRLYQLGIRSADSKELEETKGLSEISFYRVLEPLREILPGIGDKPIYLSIDIDVIDPAFAPGTGVPEPGGITSQELLDALSCLGSANVVGADIVELAPVYDSTGQTGLLAAAIVRECLLLLSPQKRNM
jgi:agmatinase